MESFCFTICNVAYLPRALALSHSVYLNDGHKVHIVIFDSKRTLNLKYDFCEISWLEDYSIKDTLNLAFKYDVVEFSTALRPWFADYFLKRNAKVIYLDPDMLVYNKLDNILSELDQNPIIITPHYTNPQNFDQKDSDLSLMRFGAFNFGFFAVNNSDESFKFLSWLTHRCYHLCYSESQFGLGTDQKWVGIAPCFFPNLSISFNLGYNVAYWNTHERVISNINGVYFVNGEFPLVFFHFSAYDSIEPKNLSHSPGCNQRNEQRLDLIEISLNYAKELKKFELPEEITKEYAYDYFSNGDKISPTLRRAYASIIEELPDNHNPFDANGIVHTFAKKNHLIGNSKKPVSNERFNDLDNYKTQFKIVTLFMRLIIRFLGPYRAMNFSRLLVFVSSYRQYRRLWKL